MLYSFKSLTKFEKRLWIFSLIGVTLSFLLSREPDILTLIACLIGVTALIFVSKGDVLGQILTVAFSLFYAAISYRFRYYGEMITYVGMTAPIAAASIVTWIKNPYAKSQVKVNQILRREALILIAVSLIVTVGFYYILRFFGTENLIVSTVSVFTSFTASALMMLRSPYYALAYAANDVVLIILWIYASMSDLSFLPMIMCFIMFLFNDIYGFFNWLKMQNRQIK